MRILGRIFAVIGFMVVLGLVVGMISASYLMPGLPPLPEKMVLKFDFSREVSENYQPDELESALGSDRVSLRMLVAALDRAAKDPRVAAFTADVTDVALDLGQIEEVRAAIARFRAAGKFTLAYADTFGELGPANREYWLASAFEQVWLQPLGLVGLTGPAAPLPFLRKALTDLGVTPDFMQRHEYKGAAGMFMADSMPAPIRADYSQLLNDLTTTIVADVGAARRLPPETVRNLMDEAPLSAARALETRLIDRIDYRQAALNTALAKAGPDNGVGLMRYLEGSPLPRPAIQPVPVGLIYIDGTILRKSDGVSPTGGAIASAEELVPALLGAVKSDARALIVRVNSPGGSVTASESIRAAIDEVRKSGKYVVVSMGDLAASGGYWVSTAGDYIIANPSTITGSIGVFGGKFAFGGLAEKFGVTVENLTTGKMSGMMNMLQPFTAEERARLNAIFDEIYAGFTDRVMAARKLTPEQVDKVARGRVWTGRRAAEVGLVDELGGLREAFGAVRKKLALAEDVPLRLTILPEPEPSYVRVLRTLRGFVALPGWLQTILPALTPQGLVRYQGPVDIR